MVAAEQDRERSRATGSGSGSTIRPTEAGKTSKRRMQLRRLSPRPTSNATSLVDAACADRDSGAVGLGLPLGTKTVKFQEAATDLVRGTTDRHGGAIVWKRVDSSVVESSSSMTTANVCTQQISGNQRALSHYALVLSKERSPEEVEVDIRYATSILC